MRCTLEQGAWVEHDAAWLGGEEADRALAALRDELAWEQRAIVLFGRRMLQPRLIAWAGDLGYRCSGQTLEPRPFTRATPQILESVPRELGEPFAPCPVN